MLRYQAYLRTVRLVCKLDRGSLSIKNRNLPRLKGSIRESVQVNRVFDEVFGGLVSRFREWRGWSEANVIPICIADKMIGVGLGIQVDRRTVCA